MSAPRITLYGSLEERLRVWLSGHPERHERGALVLFRKFARPAPDLSTSPRYVAVEIIELADDWIIDSSPVSLRINLRKFQEVYFRCGRDALMLGFAHSHPSGHLAFSPKDDANEISILHGYAGSNGPDVDLISLVLCDQEWIGRVRQGNSPLTSEAARHFSVLSEKVSLHLEAAPSHDPAILARQEAAFGKPFNRKLQSLRVGVVGLGGTGSPLATLLARSGVGELVLIDGDALEDSNLNRVRGYRMADVGRPKAEVLGSYIDSLGLPCSIAVIPEYLDRSPRAVDAVAGCDIVFGCTDDVAGRDILTQAMYYYCLGYVDVGLTGAIREDADGIPYLYDHRGRVSTVLPESGKCLRCQRVVTEAKLTYERALRDNPALAELDPETLQREYYLTGGNESAPGVGAFTSATADLAMASFMDLIRPYRRLPTDIRQDNIWYDFVHLNLYSNSPTDDPECFCCGVNGLLCVSENGYRLGMPSLGRLDEI